MTTINRQNVHQQSQNYHDFESELTLTVNNIECRNINNDFQQKLKHYIN